MYDRWPITCCTLLAFVLFAVFGAVATAVDPQAVVVLVAAAFCFPFLAVTVFLDRGLR